MPLHKGPNVLKLTETELNKQREKAQVRWNQLFAMLSRISKIPGNMGEELGSSLNPKLLEALSMSTPPGISVGDFNEDVVQCVLDSKLDLNGKFGQDILASMILHVAKNEVLVPYSIHSDDAELSSRIGAEKVRENVAQARQEALKAVSSPPLALEKTEPNVDQEPLEKVTHITVPPETIGRSANNTDSQEVRAK